MKKPQSKLTRFLFYFLIFLILFQLFNRNKGEEINKNDDIIFSSKSNFVIGKEVVIEIKNNSPETLHISNQCPTNPLAVEFYKNGEWTTKEATLKGTSPCENAPAEFASIEPNSKEKIGFGLWNRDLFDETGLYRITYETTLNEKPKSYFHEINVTPPSLIRRTWNALLYKPIFNTLFFFISKLPGHSLGWAIILLTLLIKVILLAPNQKALKSQKQLQRIQPQLDAMKQKYKDDPQRLAQETMAIWKKHKVNPMGSCLPMLIQFPILIALFYVVRDGLTVVDPSLFYATLNNFDATKINPIFLGIIDLTKVNVIVLPVIVAGLQFFQIRLSLNRSKTSGGAGNPALPMMNNMMQFFLPIMIAVFTASLPAAVGFYWGTSTLFAIGQQLVVNYSKD